jgi:hypothetical protein
MGGTFLRRNVGNVRDIFRRVLWKRVLDLYEGLTEMYETSLGSPFGNVCETVSKVLRKCE